MTEKWKQLLSSRKFWATMVGVIFMVVKTWLQDIPLE